MNDDIELRRVISLFGAGALLTILRGLKNVCSIFFTFRAKFSMEPRSKNAQGNEE